jgi:hypothetical protein
MSEITAFVSYSHDSAAHAARVLGLSQRLRQDGIPTFLDQYVNGAPSEGWPRWMLNGLTAATHVLCVCTETYHRRFRGLEVPGKGKGADWEGALVSQALYDARSQTNKFVPVLFERADEPYVPEPLRAQTHYVMDSDVNYTALYDALLGQAGVEPGAVGSLKRKPRVTAAPIAFGDGPSVPASSAEPTARSIWFEKLDFLLVEEACAIDPAMKFRLKHLIDEARAKTVELDPNSGSSLTPGSLLPKTSRDLLLFNLTEKSSLEELQVMCFELGIDFDNIPGEAKPTRAANIIQHLERRTRLGALVAWGKRKRPDLRWE